MTPQIEGLIEEGEAFNRLSARPRSGSAST